MYKCCEGINLLHVYEIGATEAIFEGGEDKARVACILEVTGRLYVEFGNRRCGYP